jgi:hypothetical protein
MFGVIAFCRSVQDLGLQVVGRLKRYRTPYNHEGVGLTLDQLYQAGKRRLVKVPALGLSLIRVPASSLPKAIKNLTWKAEQRQDQGGAALGAAIFTTDLILTAVEVMQNRWSIEVFFKEAKQRLGLGQEQGRSFAAQVFVTQVFFRYSLLAYLLERDEQSHTVGDLFRQLEKKIGKLTFLERLWQYLVTLLKTVLNTLAYFVTQDLCFEFISTPSPRLSTTFPQFRGVKFE